MTHNRPHEKCRYEFFTWGHFPGQTQRCGAGSERDTMGGTAGAASLSKLEIVPMTEQHWDAVRAIYAEGIATSTATFETSVPSWQEWDARHLRSCRLVVAGEGELLGWAALSAVSTRPVYRGVAEVSVYIAERARGRKIGAALLAALIAESEQHGIWTLQAGIFSENTVSMRLHEKLGFRIVGTRERIGCLDGRWCDTVLMERRSNVVGV
jgi:L-amino acid N-acyltransferase YncA